METSAFDYELPPERIAQQPLARRDAARLLVDRGGEVDPDDRHVHDLPDLLEPGDLLVVNTTRVLPARLHLRKRTGGAVEVLLLDRLDTTRWEALVRPGRRVPPGTRLESATGELAVEVGDDLGDGVRAVEVEVACARAPADDAELFAALDRAGEVPLPPYIDEALDDAERYQTVYADRPGSVAAPTAGLHLTTDVLERCKAHGIELATVELNVGLGTFRPIAAEKVEQHVMHGERYCVPPETIERAERAQRVVAVGTTVVRALESAAATGELEGRTELFIHGNHRFRVVDRLVTNFHLPRSSLLVMIDAFAGARWRDLYATALNRGYRFLSFGDAMLLTRRDQVAS